MEANRSAFAILKPSCVRLSELSLQLSDARAPAQDVAAALDEVLATVRAVQARGLAFDSRLAEYVFFPLSGIFRERQNVPSRLLETSLRCLNILLSTGWSHGLDGGLAVQLLIMLTFLAGGNPTAPPTAPRPSDELKYEALACQHRLLLALSRSAEASRARILDAATIPALGHAVTVLLDAAKNGPSVDIQLAALSALESLCNCIDDRPALASFLPGIVSTLTQILTPSTKQSQPYKALVTSLLILIHVIKFVLADNATFPLPKTKEKPVQDGPIDLGESWLNATAAQVKMALANVMRLKKHDRRQVRSRLRELCLMLLEDCPRSLQDSISLALETLFFLVQTEGDDTAGLELAQAVLVNPEMVEQVRSSLYNWLMSMPRILLSNDDEAKKIILGQVSASFKLLSGTDVEMTIVNDSLLSSLQDGLLSIVKGAVSGVPTVDHVLPSDSPAALDLNTIDKSHPEAFPSVFNFRTAQTALMSSLSSLIKNIAMSEKSIAIAQEALDQARFSTDTQQTINLWLALNLARHQTFQDDIVNPSDFLAIDITTSSAASLREDLYSFALDILKSEPAADDTLSWQVQALALETVALQAYAQQSDFRPELVDALYPVVHHLGSPNTFLRRHAALSLDSIALSCKYTSAQVLLVENADYLVNAVGTKLNAFNVEPQAPQVLRMLAKLCGPKIVPYLDDIVDGVFEALDCFHSYPSLVELLFSALGAVVEESSKADVMRYEEPAKNDNRQPPLPKLRKEPMQPKTLADVAAKLRSRRNKRKREADDAKALMEKLPSETPHKPWAELRSHVKDTKEEAKDDDSPVPKSEEKAPPLTKPYLTTLRIATSIEHHLTTPSAHTRLSLLRVLAAALPYLSRHEDSFLPFINSIWPVLAPRLRDTEVYIVCATLDVMGQLVEGAGDFMSSRIEALWSEVTRLWSLANPTIESTQYTSDGARGTRITGNVISATEISSIASMHLSSKKNSPSTSKTESLPSLSEPIISLTPSKPSGYNKADNLLIPASSRSLLSSSHQSQRQDLVAVSSTSSIPPSNFPKQDQITKTRPTASSPSTYTPTTTLRLRSALITFSTRILTHTRLTPSIRSDIQTWLLPYAFTATPAATPAATATASKDTQLSQTVLPQTGLVSHTTSHAAEDTDTSPADVYAALRDTNPDLIWLAREEAKWRADPTEAKRIWETRWAQLPTSYAVALPADQAVEGAQQYEDRSQKESASEFEFDEPWARREEGMGVGQVRWSPFVF